MTPKARLEKAGSQSYRGGKPNQEWLRKCSSKHVEFVLLGGWQYLNDMSEWVDSSLTFEVSKALGT